MKIRTFYLYLAYVLWLAVLGFLLFTFDQKVTGFGITLGFLTLILTPGILIKRLLKIESNFLTGLLYSVALGFGFYFLLNLVALFANLSIIALLFLYFVILAIIFLVALVNDWDSSSEFNFLYFKGKSWADWLLSVAIIAFSALAFFAVDAQSDKLIGDGWFHLAILQKVVSGDGLSPTNLWVTKTTTLNPVYSFPIWHILIGSFSKILGVSALTAFRQVLLPLFLMALIVWYGLISKLFQKRELAGVVYLVMLLIFLKDNFFYYFVALGSPDSFNRLFFLPLILFLILNFVFEKNSPKLLNIVLISILTVMLGLIHFTQLLYLVLILIIAVILFSIFKRDKDNILRLIYLLGGIAILTLPYLLIIQRELVWNWLKENFISTHDVAKYKTPQDVSILFRYTVLALPILVLYFKKQRELILAVSIAVTSILISWQVFGLRMAFFRTLGPLFVERAIANIPTFIFVGFLLYLIIYGLNLLFAKSKIALWAANAVLVAALLAGFFSESVRSALTWFSKTIVFGDSLIFGKYFWAVFGLVAVASLLIYFYRKNPELPEPKEKLNFVLLAISIIILFSLPYQAGLKKVFAANPNGTIFTDRSTKYASDIRTIGGESTIDFLNSVPKHSVFLTDNPTISVQILLYSDNLAAEYPYSIRQFSQSAKFYDPTLEENARLEILDELKVNYILIRHSEDEQFVAKFPDYFQKVFTNSFGYPVAEGDITNLVPVEYNFYQYLKGL